MLSYPEGAAKPGAEAEEVVADSAIAADKCAVHGGASGRALYRVHSGSDVQRQSRVVLQHAAQLKAMTDLLPDGACGLHRGMDGAVEHDAVALIVIGAPVVLPDVVLVDRRAEE